MSLLICDDCTTAYSVGAPKCPHCGSTYAYEQGAGSDPAQAVFVADPAADEEDLDAEDL